MRRLSLAHVLAAAAPALLVVTFLVGSAPDEEEFRWGILSSFLHARALAGGTLLSWTSTLGLGLPQPMVPNFNLHPLMPLLAAGVWSLCRTLEVAPVVRAVAVLTYLLATPTQNYALTDLWLSHYVMWTMGPWLLLLGLSAGSPSPRRTRGTCPSTARSSWPWERRDTARYVSDGGGSRLRRSSRW